MKNLYLLLFLFLTLISDAQINGRIPPCGTDQIWAQMVQRDSSLLVMRHQMDLAISKLSGSAPHTTGASRSAGGATTVIPVVIYIVYDSTAYNISMTQIQSQMNQLNQDFAPYGYTFCYARRNVSDTSWFAPQAGDSAGVFRTHSPLSNVTPANDAQLKALSSLPSANYLRIFVVHTISPAGVLGYAFLPGTSGSQDGIVMRSDVFGSHTFCAGCPLLSQYDMGASLTHECGHYLDLYHTFQGGCDTGTAFMSCAYMGDWVCDTPPTDGSFGCPSPAPLSCNGVDRELVNNYMDYTNDGCKNAFTPGQNVRMDFSLQVYRQALVSTQNLINTGVTCIQLGNQYANFFCANFDGCLGRPMTFASLHSPGFTYTWSFGDGTTAIGDTVQHIYTASGQYPVTLIASGAALGITATQTIPVFIGTCSPIACRYNKWESNFAFLDFSTGTPIAQNHPKLDPTYPFPDWHNSIYYYRADTLGRPLFHFSDFINGTSSAGLIDTSYHTADTIINMSSTQLLPVPGSDSKFCIVGFEGGGYRMRYSFIQTANGTVSAIPGKKNKILPTPPGAIIYTDNGKMVSIPNCDGTKFWIIGFFNNSTLGVYELNGNDTVMLHQSYVIPGLGAVNLLQPSPDGRKIVLTVAANPPGNWVNYLVDFDKATGMLLSSRIVDTTSHSYYPPYSGGDQATFSPNSRFLYTTDRCCDLPAGNIGYIYQLDLYSADPWASRKEVYQFTRNNDDYKRPFITIAAGPDRKLYVGSVIDPGNSAQNYRYGVINYPDVLENGTHTTGFNYNGPYIVPANCPFVQGAALDGFHTNLNNVDAYGCDWTPGVPRPFSYAISGCQSYTFHSDECFTTSWHFGDPASGAADSSVLGSPVHTFSHTGDYPVRLTTGGVTYTDTLHIGAPHTQIAATAISPCPAPHANYSISNVRSGVTYFWTISHGTPSTTQGAAIDVQWTTGDTTGIITVVAVDAVLGCTDTATMIVHYRISGTAAFSYISHSICQGGSYVFHGRTLTSAGIYFDTTTVSPGCLIISQLTLQIGTPAVSWSGGTTSLSSMSGPVQLTGGIPLGGTYSGTGVIGSTFDPATGGPGSHTITYTYTDSNGCSGTATRDFIVLGISDPDLERQIQLFPNPANNNLTVQSDLFATSVVEINVYDMTGRLLAIPVQRQSDKALLDLSGISDGIYSIKMIINDREVSKRFIRLGVD